MDLDARLDKPGKRKRPGLDSCPRVQRKAHPDDFKRLTESFTTPELLKLLGIPKPTLKRWLAGETSIPWSAFQLAFDHSPYGLAERDAMEHYHRATMQGLVEALERKVAHLEALLRKQAKLVDWGCANDPFINPTDPRTEELLEA